MSSHTPAAAYCPECGRLPHGVPSKGINHKRGCSSGGVTSDPAARPEWSREWDVASIPWHRVTELLNRGYEPFAVTIGGPHGNAPSDTVTVYLRRRA